MTPFDIFIVILVIIILIGFNGLYVAAEFSAVSASKPRLSQMAANGNRRAELAVDIIDDPKGLDDFIAACQLGITLTSLVLGFYGQARLSDGLRTWLVDTGENIPILGDLSPDTISTILILFVLTIVAVLLGELIPKNLGVQRPERLLLLTITPMKWSMWLFRPLIWFFNGSGALILRLFGASATSEHAHVHSPQEIQILVEESNEGGVLDSDERKLLVNTLQLRDVTARKVMIPRNRMLTANISKSPQEMLERLARSRFSRLPLFEGTIDKIVGFVHLKDLLSLVHQPATTDDPQDPLTVRDVLRPVVILPETLPVESILESMQRDQNYMVIVADEYGGTSGMITVEDLFEEIIGEFYDEFDLNRQLIHIGPDNSLYVNGDIQVDDLNEWLDFYLPEEDADTIGGLVFSLHEKLPDVGDKVTVHARGRPTPSTHDYSAGHSEADGTDSSLEHSANAQVQNADDPETILEQIGDLSADSPEKNDRSTGDINQVDRKIEITVEKMQDNSIREISFQITDMEVALLHKHEIF